MPTSTIAKLFACLLLILPTLSFAQLAPSPDSARPIAPEPGLAQADLPPPMPVMHTVFNGRQQDIEVENLDNPMVIIQTTRGNLLFELFPAEAPATVANFIGLAEGTKPWIDPLTGQTQLTPYYDGLLIHKIRPGFIIQAGSKTGDDTDYPGYFIADEINATSLGLDQMDVVDPSGTPNPVLGIRSQEDFQTQVLKPVYEAMNITTDTQLQARLPEVDKRIRSMTVKNLYELQGYHYLNQASSRAPVSGVLAMANNGPNTNGSQFFITLADAPWLLGRHTVFGKIRAGMNVLSTISTTRVDRDFRPQADINILAIRMLNSPASPTGQ